MTVPLWVSTRGAEAEPVGFADAMLRGLAPDGGLYVPTTIPSLGPVRAEGFTELAGIHLRGWLGDASGVDTDAVVREALDFPVPLIPLDEYTAVLELFHGPTLSFKDFGARTMARLMSRVLRRTRGERTVFVATSGDTGSAVADGFAGLERIRVVLLYPDGQVSPVQERQLAVARPGVLSIPVRGAFDDCQRLVKGVFADRRFDGWGPTSANSINVARLVPQSIYHAWAAVLIPNARIVVPSGNLGNLTAGVLARGTGAPVAGFVAAHNANHGFVDWLAGGEAPGGTSVTTLSNAMDVGLPSNFERLASMVPAESLRRLVQGDWVDDAATLDTMARTYEETGYVADPHTAVGLRVVERLRKQGDEGPFVVLATAHPAKFPRTVHRATGMRPDEPGALARLPDVDPDRPVCEPTLDALLERIRAWTSDEISG